MRQPSTNDNSPADGGRVSEREINVFRRLIPYMRPHWKKISFGLLLLVVSIPAQNFHPIAWAYIVDEVIGKRRVEMLIPAVLAMFAAQGIGTVLGAWRTNLLQKVGQDLVYDLRNDVYAKLQAQSLSYHHDNRAGDLVSRVMGDVDQMQEVAVNGTDSVVANSLQFVYVAGVLIAYNWKLGIATLIPIFLVGVLTKYFNEKVKSLYRGARDRLGDVNARLQENLTGLPLIKAFAREDYELNRFRGATQSHREINFHSINARTIFFPAVGFVGFFSNLISVGYGAWLVLQGQFTVGGLVAYRGYWWPLFAPINQLATINEMLQRAQAAGSRVFEVLDAPTQIRDTPGATTLEYSSGRVAFENVTFDYNGGAGNGEPALREVSFEVPPDRMIALVGPSGAGKTTTLNLLLRFYDATGGHIRIDGHDIKDVTQDSLRRHMALVPQDPFLFNGTIAGNIRYGNLEASQEQVEAAARAANAHDFIAALPSGYDTEIGERGVKLSGGQRQRIAIARAFLADPKILILDEPTSSVEPESEWIVQQSLERLMKGRTTFVTSHRLSLVRNADLILVFNDGRLVERGTHRELLEHEGLYADMYELQMGENRVAAA